jgi:AdoMet-dependent heme synthase
MEASRGSAVGRLSTVVWEPTRACDATCAICRPLPDPRRSQFELTTEEGFRLIDQISALSPWSFVFSGGDPLKRPDIFNFVEYASSLGLAPSLTPSATPLLTDESILELKRAGLSRLSVSLDGPSAEIHDGFRGVAGSFEQTLRAIRYANRIALPVQINTTLSRPLLGAIPRMADLLQDLGIRAWNLFLPVHVRGDAALTAAEVETAFAEIYDSWKRVNYEVTTTEATHFHRYVIQQRLEDRLRNLDAVESGVESDQKAAISRAVHDISRNFIFISHLGDVSPSPFLPLSAGNVRKQPLGEIYRESELFRDARDTSRLKGKCSLCEYHEICGGSRARAYSAVGDFFAADPLCAYHPPRFGGSAPPV